MNSIQTLLIEIFKQNGLSLAESFTGSQEVLEIFKMNKIKLPKNIPFRNVRVHETDKKFIYVTDDRKKEIMMKFTSFLQKLLKHIGITDDKEIQKYQRIMLDQYKAIAVASSTGAKEYSFEVWNDVMKTYSPSSFGKDVSSSSQLGDSCMNGMQGYLGLYKDDSKIKSLVMLDNKGKILSRALVWTNMLINGSKGVFVDRIYSAKNEYDEYMKKEIRERGWSYRTTINIKDVESVSKGTSSKNAKLLYYTELDKWNSHPFMDTMFYALYDTEKKAFCLSNVPGDQI